MLLKHEHGDHWHEDGQKITGPHVLADVDVERDEAEEINRGVDELPDQGILLRSRKVHERFFLLKF